jgi:hypothetical protein
VKSVLKPVWAGVDASVPSSGFVPRCRQLMTHAARPIEARMRHFFQVASLQFRGLWQRKSR